MEKLKKLKENWLVITFFLSLLFGAFMFAHNLLNKIDEVQETINTTQQMALKSVIWNEEIPLVERASACDVYLSAGYNSLTKRECQAIIDKGVSEGVFSNIKKVVD